MVILVEVGLGWVGYLRTVTHYKCDATTCDFQALLSATLLKADVSMLLSYLFTKVQYKDRYLWNFLPVRQGLSTEGYV